MAEKQSIHYSDKVGAWCRCRAATEETCPYADSHDSKWQPPEDAPTREEFLAAERERKAVKAALSRERARERNRRNVAAWRARQRAGEDAGGLVNPREVEALGELLEGAGAEEA